MFTLAMQFPLLPDRVVSASADGSAAVWGPAVMNDRGPDAEPQPPMVTWKAHDDGVVRVMLARGPGDQDPPTPRLLTLGAFCDGVCETFNVLQVATPFSHDSCAFAV